MRFVQVLVGDERRGDITGALEEREIDYFVSAGRDAGGDLSMIYFPIPTNAVAPVLADLREAGLTEDAYTVVTNAEFAVTEHMNDVQERYAAQPTHIAPAELRAKAKDMRPGTRAFVWMMFLAAVVATAGLLLGSPAVIVGSMVIAPMVSPALTASVGALRNDPDMFVDSVEMQTYGLGLAVVGATAFGYLVRLLGVVPPMLAVSDLQFVGLRITPGFLSVAIALSAGAAAAYGLATTGSSSIVGVMIAAALIPTAATVGIGIAWNAYVLAAGALVLLLVNVLSINLAALLTLGYLGYGSITSRVGYVAVGTRRGVAVSLAVLVVLAVLLVGTTVGTYQQVTFERQVNGAVTGTLDEDRYSSLRFDGIQAEYAATPFDTSPASVRVTVVDLGGGSHPELPSLLARRIERRTGKDVTVEVAYTSVGRSGAAVENRTEPVTQPSRRLAHRVGGATGRSLSSRGPEASLPRRDRRSPRPSWICRGSC